MATRDKVLSAPDGQRIGNTAYRRVRRVAYHVPLHLC